MGQFVMTTGNMRMPLSSAHNSDSLPMVSWVFGMLSVAIFDTLEKLGIKSNQ